MIKIFMTFMVLMTSHKAMSQNTSITYQQSVHVDFDATLDEADSSDVQYDVQDDEDELVDFDEKLKTYMTAKLEAEKNNKYKYILGQEKIRYIRPDTRPGLLFDEEFILLDRNKRLMDHYTYSNEKGGELMTFEFDRTKLRDIDVVYRIDTLKSDRREILGYDCYRVVILETIRDLEYGEEILEYDCYVTDDIDLPFHLLNTTLKPILDSCPLEMKTHHRSSGTTYSTYTAIEINDSDDTVIVVPKKFKDH